MRGWQQTHESMEKDTLSHCVKQVLGVCTAKGSFFPEGKNDHLHFCLVNPNYGEDVMVRNDNNDITCL